MADRFRSVDLDSEIESGTGDGKNAYLSVLWYSGCFGASYYDVETAMLNFLLETVEMPPFSLVQNLIEELKPAAVITSAKQDRQFLDALQRFQMHPRNSASSVSSDYSSEDVPMNSSGDESLFLLEMLSSVEFDYRSSKQRILSIELPGVPKHYSLTERAMHLSSLVPFDSVSTIRATGGLLRYLEKKRIGILMDNPTLMTPIIGFHLFASNDKLFIDKASYKVLQIFQSVSHPSAYKLSTREGLSLFGVLNRTITRHGCKLLKTWFYHPTNDLAVLKRRLDVVSFLVNGRNEEILNAFKSSLRHVKNVCKILAKVKTSKLNIADWNNILQTAQNAMRIADICHGITNMLPADQIPVIFKDIVKNFGSDLNGVVTMITNHMDVTASKQENRFVVLPGVSEVIDQMKKTYSQLPALLDRVAQQEIESYNDYLTSCQIVYMRRIGYLLFASKDTFSDAVDDSFVVPGMTFVAATDETVFYKTPATQNLDEEYGDILENIAYHEMEIMTQIQNTLLEHAAVFLNVLQHSAELDCLLSLAVVAKNYNYARPSFVESSVLDIVGSRHPLQEHAVPLFVPNNISFGQETGLIKVLTGPNASGKSVYLKQVGLIVFMSHVGSFVPAESACIGRISAIYTIVRSPESSSSSLSSFASDLNRISTAINKADEESLVLIDEFGKGTATVDGVSLLASCLSHFIHRSESPMVLCTTHFHCLTQQNLLPASDKLRFQAMDTVSERNDSTAYLFQLVDGVSKQSHASVVARVAGIPPEIITRGFEINKIMQRNAPIYKFNRSSALTYQLHCNDVAEYAVKDKIANCNELKLLLSDITSMLKEKSSSKSTDESTVSS